MDLIMIGGIISVILGLGAAYYFARPHIKRKQAISAVGKESAMPRPHQNPKIPEKREEFVDIGSEPNPFLRR